ncbi:MAG: phosphate acyltransferase PlsX [Firmicutes bacterium]|nr:phosphate acyltransferase PlsX [Bacillota bacterium]
MRIAVDAMGGDNAPFEIVKGCVQACDRVDDQIILVGKEALIQAELDKYEGQYAPGHIVVQNADDVIHSDESPVQAVRKKTGSSMVVAMDMVKRGEADAVLSAGNTGALMVAGLLRLGRIPGVERPAIVSPFPHIDGSGFSLLTDAGANAECWASNLLCFAKMGSIYMTAAFKKENPTVGLINIGTEENKGTEMLKEAYKLLKDSDLNFVGNVEARELSSGAADVMVCDGFTGNIVLKLAEGVALDIMKTVKQTVSEGAVSKVGGLLLKGKLRGLKSRLDYSVYGGAPILGLKGAVFKMHGSSKAFAVENALVRASAAISAGFIDTIAEAMKEPAQE